MGRETSGNSLEAWKRLTSEMGQEGAYVINRLKPQLMRKAYMAAPRRAFVDREGDRIICHGSLIKTADPAWMELAQLWVAPHVRANGCLSRLATGTLNLIPQGSRFLFTQEEKVQRVAKDLGFNEVCGGTLPNNGESLIEWGKRLGIAERIPPHLLIGGEAQDALRLFVRLP
jgi:hypothetical protein